MLNDPIKNLKRRSEEKTASTSIKKGNDGIWIVCDWGEWSKPKNAIGICMYEDNLSFGEACKKLAELYQIEYKDTQFSAKPVIKKRDKKKSEKKGDYLFKYKKELTEKELLSIGPAMTNDVAVRFRLKSVVYFAYVKDKEVIETHSTEDYPIFVFDFGDWQKIYQPKSLDKSFRFRYAGGRPKDFLFGLDDAKDFFNELREEELSKDIKDKTRNANIKLKRVIVCSGESDALNMASFGYEVVWKNSESAILTKEQYKTLKGIAEDICNLPDIDATGVREAVKLGLTYLKIKTIWLPSYLLKSKDWRGNPRKDLKDFIQLKYNSEKPNNFRVLLRKLVENALPMQFWDEVVKTDSNGKYKGTDYIYNIVHAEHFLKHQGFFRMETPNEKEDYCYIHIEGNTVKRTTPNKIENYVNKFLEDRQEPIPLRNMVKKTPYLKEGMLSKLPLVEIDFVDNDVQNQFWFFKNGVLQINKNELKLHQNGVVNKMVWDEKIIDFPKQMSHKSFANELQKKHFEIFADRDGDDDIRILKTDNKFLNYLINASRVHWRKDLEDSFKNKGDKQRDDYFKKHQFDIAAPNLNEDEILEQKHHLINKIFALGYLLHKYKDSSRAWFVYGMDNKLSDMGESHGGSGKTLMFSNLEYIMKNQFYIPGRSKKTIESEFLFDGVDKDVDYIFIDDMDPRFPVDQFFSEITGKMRVNGKNTKAYTLSFPDSPKMSGTSNFPPINLDPSTARRILFTVNSDYYHHNKDNEYLQTRGVADDFGGIRFFTQFTEQDFLDFYVLMAQCVQYFLSTPDKKDPPMDNVKKRNLLAEMGPIFKSWAEVYFSKENGLLDQIISRKIAYTKYKDSGGKKNPNSFKKSVIAFCKFHGYVFDPKDENIPRTSDGRIVKKVSGESHECFYIKTIPTPIDPKTFEEPETPDYENDEPY